eukprot:TRINITY_DN10181_c0_g2_i1.p1 TRINITY_DN10181_c0_g2~~TRINITY_DN10181_c0_g2_i1.p1  ORF type:complete len:339 (-),score=65.66 TRINITY_DN10181_c0_g2_i1:105-1121(-)
MAEPNSTSLNLINERVRECDLDRWYTALEDLTYPSIFHPITIPEAQAMREVYRLKELGSPIPPSIQITIDTIEKGLQSAMDQFPDGSFVKLSSRSAKDSSISGEHTKQIYRDLISKYEQPSMNDKLVSIYRAHILALRLHHAREVLNMFLSSERIDSDLDLALEFKDQWSQHFVVRKFVDIPIEYEFRAFVVNDELRAMCQYYHWMFFPTLLENKEKLNSLILHKFHEIKHRIPILSKTYVVDWAVDLGNSKVYIIELNPFGDYEGMGTSPAMFALNQSDGLMDRQGADRNIFFGDGTYEFRLEEKPVDEKEVWGLLCTEWKRLFNEKPKKTKAHLKI